MDEIKISLLRVVGYQLFNGDKPNINQKVVFDILKEAEAQTVFSLAFSYLQTDVQNISIEVTVK